MVLWSLCDRMRRFGDRIWKSSLRVKSPRYHVIGEEAENAPYESLWELVNAAFPSSLLIGCLVVAGQVGGHVSGPSGILSAVIAAISVSLSGICYAEFRARWPRVCGSPYEYTYLSTGEGVAFIVAWMSLLQDVTMVAAAGRASSQNMDFLFDNIILNKTKETIGCISLLDSCPDFLGGGLVILVSILVSCGVRKKQKLIGLITNCAALLVLVFVLIVGLFHLDFTLWKDADHFFPSSYPGVIQGAAISIYAFSSFEIICGRSDFSRQTSGRTALTGFALSSFISFGVFMAVSATTTLLIPINSLFTETPLPEAFTQAGVTWIKFIICIPSLLAMLVFMWMTLIKIHDLLEAVSLDALLCSNFSNTSERTHMAPLSIMVPAILTAIFTVIFSLTDLLQLASLASLLVFTITCTAAVCIRFRPSILVHSPEHTTHKDRQERRKHRKQKQGFVEAEPVRNGGYGSVSTNNNTDDCPMLVMDSEDEEENFVGSSNSEDFLKDNFKHQQRNDDDSDTDIDDAVEEYKEQLRIAALTSCTFITPKSDAPTDRSARRAAWTLTLFILCLFFLFLILTHGVRQVRAGNAVLIILIVLLLIIIFLLLFILLRQPQDPVSEMDLRISFPLSPWIPILAIILNLHLAVHLSGLAWVQTVIVFIIGCLIYFIYGIRNSRASHFYQFLPEEETILLPEPPRHLVEPRVLSTMSRASSMRSCDLSYTSSEPDIPLVD